MIKVDLKRKLNNNEGKTILMALFLLLVAIVVSVVIIGAATTAAHQLNDNKDAQQAYLTASSAAQLFRDEIESKTYTKSVTTYSKTNDNLPDMDSSETQPTVNGELKPLIESVLTEIMADTTTDGTFEYSVPLSNKKVEVETSNIDAFDEVYIDVDVTGGLLDETGTSSRSNYSYNMGITFEVKGENDEQGYRLALRIPITKTIEVTTATTENYQYTYYNWIGQKKTGYAKYNTTTTTTTITFGSGTMTREGLTYNQGGNQ